MALPGTVSALASLVLAFLPGPGPDRGIPSPEQSVQALIAEDRRVSAVAYRLAVANAELCDDIGPQWGLTLHSRAQYGPRLRPAVDSLFDIGGDVAVSVVVPDGPADRAGLRPGDRISSINGRPLRPAPLPSPRAAGSFGQVEAALALLGQEANGGATLTVLRNGRTETALLVPARGCAYDTQVTPGSDINARADGRHVFITSGFVSYADRDADLALVLGHELAHNVLHHRARLDRSGFARRFLGNLGSSPGDLIRVEREADYVGLYLTARAGFDIRGGEAFWMRMIADMGDPWYRRWSHPGSRERARNTRETVQEIEDLIREGQPLQPRNLPAPQSTGTGR